MSCATCGQALPAKGIGRPRLFCSNTCQRVMVRRRLDVEILEADLAAAREKQANGFWPGAADWKRRAELLEADLADLRARTLPASG
jgi:endogenous inhibitor of DNA gyrase (YacG/DUF329 family)